MRRIRPSSLPRSAAALLLAAPAAAQFPVHVIGGDSPGDFFGRSVAGVGDVDGDGYGDFIGGAPNDDDMGSNSGSASVHSGLSGALLHRFLGANPTENFGYTVAGGGDVDGDGISDIAIAAAYYNGIGPIQGRVEVRSGATGALIWSLEGQNSFSLFGSALAIGSDLDGDGFADIVIGASNDDGNANDSGIVYVYSGVSGQLLYQVSGDNATDQLGTSVANAGDVNGDGAPDWIGGAPLGDVPFTDAGTARVYSGPSGSAFHSKNGPAASAHFGRSVAGAGDLDLDGRAEFAVGAPGDAAGGANAGSVSIFRGQGGTLLRRYDGVPGARLGTSMASAGDYDGDGRLDLIVGAPGEGSGVVRVFSGATGAVLASISAGAYSIGEAVGGGFDVNGDGRSEIVVGGRLANANAGELVVYSSVNLLGSAYCFGDGSASSCPCGNPGGAGEGCANSSGAGARITASGTASVSSDDLLFHAAGLLPGQPALLFSGLNATNGGNGIAFGDGLRCTGGDVRRLGVRFPNAQGEATWGPGIAGSQGFGAGLLRRFQAWYRNPTGSPCGSNFNLSHGLELVFLP